VRDDRKAAAGGGSPDVERELGRLAAAPVPAGLRGRVLDRAFEARARAVLTPGLRRLAVACLAVIVAVAALGPLVGRYEAARLAALLDGRMPAPQAEGLAPELAELLAGDEKGAVSSAARQALAASAVRADRATNLFEVRERLKGWFSDEDLEDPD
jgi:hypothetical protein